MFFRSGDDRNQPTTLEQTSGQTQISKNDKRLTETRTQEDFSIPQKASAWVKGCYEWDRQKQHELGYHAGFPPSKDTETGWSLVA